MKNSTINDKDWFFLGAMLACKKELLSGEIAKPLYKKITLNSKDASTQTAATTAGIVARQIPAGKNYIMGPSVSFSSTIGNDTASTAIAWSDADIDYSVGDRCAARKMDVSSFISRLLHTVIPEDTDYATGSTGYLSACDSALDLWMLMDYFISRKAIVALNSPGVEMAPGDIIFYSENKTNAMIFHATDVAVCAGNSLVVKASRKNNGVVLMPYDTANIVMIARPNLIVAGEEGITVTEDMVGMERYNDGIHEYAIPVLVDNIESWVPAVV